MRSILNSGDTYIYMYVYIYIFTYVCVLKNIRLDNDFIIKW